MADVFNPLTGHSFFKVDEGIAKILLDLNLVKPIHVPKATRPPEYCVIRHESTKDSSEDRWVIVRRSFRSADMPADEQIYGGTPDGAFQAFRDVPEAIVEQYRAALAAPLPRYANADQSIADAEAVRKRQNAMGATAGGHTLNMPLPGGEK
jgi:hypothetical protein